MPQMRISFVIATLALAACAAPAPLIKTVEVPITKYVRQPIDPGLLAPCVYVEPDRACWREGKREFCNGQLVTMLTDYRAAMAQCNAQISAIATANGSSTP